jgi:hypothetical protein
MGIGGLSGLLVKSLCNAIYSRVLIVTVTALLVLAAGNVQAVLIPIRSGKERYGYQHQQRVAIPIDLGKTGTSIDKSIVFSDLNETSLNGQTLALDFTFTGNKFGRLFTITSGFEVAVTLQTEASSSPGFLDGVGFLEEGSTGLHPPQELGSASSSSGEMIVGLFPPSDLQRPLDFSAIHFDLIFPVNPSVEVTGGKFQLLSTEGAPFGVGPGIPADIVPDVGGTFLLLSIGLAGVIGLTGCYLPRAATS